MSCWFEVTEGHIFELITKFRVHRHKKYLEFNEVRPSDEATESLELVHVSGLKNDVVFLRVNILGKKNHIIAVKQGN